MNWQIDGQMWNMESTSKRWGEISALILIVILCTCIGSTVITARGITKLSQNILLSLISRNFKNKSSHFSENSCQTTTNRVIIFWIFKNLECMINPHILFNFSIAPITEELQTYFNVPIPVYFATMVAYKEESLIHSW